MSDLIQFREDGDCLWIALRATPLDLSGTPEMAALVTEIERSGIVRLIVDLSALSHFGSNVLGMLVLLWRKVARQNGRLILLDPTPIGREVLAISCLDQLWPIANTREEARQMVCEADVEA